MKGVIIVQAIPVLYASWNGLGKSVNLITPAVLVKVELVGRQIEMSVFYRIDPSRPPTWANYCICLVHTPQNARHQYC